jgi:subtilisin family serine protease
MRVRRSAGPAYGRAGWLTALLALAPIDPAAAASDSIDVIVHCQRPCAGLASRIEAMGGSVTRIYQNVGGLAARLPAADLGRLRAQPGVEAVEGDSLVHLPRQRGELPAAFPFAVDVAKVVDAEGLEELGALPALHSSYLGAFTGAEDVWEETGLGAGSLVAVIDSGTHADHVCLRGRVIAGPDLSTDAGTPFEGSTRVDNFFHGTFVAGQVASMCAFEIEAGSGFDANLPPEAKIPLAPGVFRVPLLGIAPRSEIYAVKIFPHTGASVPHSTVIAALDHVITLKRSGALEVDAINLSFGGFTLHDGRSLQERLVDEATRAGIVVAVSAGNDGPSPSTVSQPGTAFSAVTVGAASDPVHTRVFLDEFYGFVGAGAVLYPADELRIFEFSGQGPYADGRPGPDLVATGLFNFGLYPLAPPGPAFVWSSGTSFAAPQIAGGAALLQAWAKAHEPSLDAYRIRRALIDGAVPLGDEWSVHSQGSGMLNLPNALAILRGSSAAVGIRRASDPRAVRGARVRAGVEPRATFASARGRLRPNVRFGQSGAFHERVRLERGRWVDWVLEIDEGTNAVLVEVEPVGGAIPPGPSGPLGFPESFELFVKSAKRGGVEPDFVDGANVFDAARVEIRAGAVILHGGIANNLVTSPPAVLEPGLLKVTLESDWTNNTRFLAADVRITRVQGAKPEPLGPPTAVVGDAETRTFPIEIPVGTASARFDLAWNRDWRRFPTDDLDLIVVSPSGAEDFRAATLNAPESVAFDRPEPGTWTAIVDGFSVHRGQAPFILQVTLE